MQALYYVRHGQSQSNLQRVFAGRVESPLTELGAEQAAITGKSLQATKIDYIISSASIRAYDTAVIIARAIDYPIDKIERT